MRYFRAGGFLYGMVYMLWRGHRQLIRLLTTWFYRRVLGECGSRTVFGNSIYISDPKHIRIGLACYVGDGVTLGSEHNRGYLLVGNGVQISDHCKIDFTGGVTLEDNVLLSNGVTIYSHDHGYDPRSHPADMALLVGRNAWIGAHAIILPSTGRIGCNAIVGAGSVVTKPVPDGAIVAGNPARLVKMRQDL